MLLGCAFSTCRQLNATHGVRNCSGNGEAAMECRATCDAAVFAACGGRSFMLWRSDYCECARRVGAHQGIDDGLGNCCRHFLSCNCNRMALVR